MLRWTGWLMTGLLVAAAAYELALALGAGSVGPEPGEGVAGSGIVEVVALVGMVAGAALAPFAVVRPWPAALFAPMAAAYLAAFYFTDDPYYAPTIRRYSDGGAAGGRWIAAVVVIAVANGVLTRLQPRIGRFTTTGVVLLVLLTTALAGDGH